LDIGKAHTPRYLQPLLERIGRGEIDPSFVISHRLNLSDASSAYSMFNQRNGCTKVVMRPS
jgi:threonine dehydrogenase-like Zn-dependent dehydrogenase